jgi:hypothetical protein
MNAIKTSRRKSLELQYEQVSQNMGQVEELSPGLLFWQKPLSFSTSFPTPIDLWDSPELSSKAIIFSDRYLGLWREKESLLHRKTEIMEFLYNQII